MKVLILRGPSGAGKSKFTEGFPSAVIVSADDFWWKPVNQNNPSGNPIRNVGTLTYPKLEEYDFNPMLLNVAHSNCFKKFLDAVRRADNDTIVVDNTNIHIWEFQNYISAARLGGYEVGVVEFVAETVEDLKELGKRNQHRVPVEVICKMALGFEPYEDALRYNIHGKQIS